MNQPRIYILILNYRQWNDTLACLESVLNSTYRNFSILVIDNDSKNQSFENIISHSANPIIASAGHRVYNSDILTGHLDFENLPPVTFIRNTVNAGFAGGNNIILKKLAGLEAYVWLLNPDMVIQADTLAELVQFAGLQTAQSIIGANIRKFSGNKEPYFYGGGRVNFLSGTVRLIKNQGSADRLDYISGGCLFTHAGNFKKYGLLPEDYFLYWEETEWCYRAKQLGVALIVCPAAICYDKVSTVIGKGFLADYYYTRNGLLFISKFRKKNLPLALFAMKLRWLKRIVTGQWGRARGVWKGTLDFLKGKFNEA